MFKRILLMTFTALILSGCSHQGSLTQEDIDKLTDAELDKMCKITELEKMPDLAVRKQLAHKCATRGHFEKSTGISWTPDGEVRD